MIYNVYDKNIHYNNDEKHFGFVGKHIFTCLKKMVYYSFILTTFQFIIFFIIVTNVLYYGNNMKI